VRESLPRGACRRCSACHARHSSRDDVLYRGSVIYGSRCVQFFRVSKLTILYKNRPENVITYRKSPEISDAAIFVEKSCDRPTTNHRKWTSSDLWHPSCPKKPKITRARSGSCFVLRTEKVDRPRCGIRRAREGYTHSSAIH
jgi:hypothetical protein